MPHGRSKGFDRAWGEQKRAKRAKRFAIKGFRARAKQQIGASMGWRRRKNKWGKLGNITKLGFQGME